MNEHEEYLLLAGAKGETRHISSNDICYIEAEGRHSTLYLNTGKSINMNILLGDFSKLIDKWFPFNHKYFYRVGKSLIINKKYLSAFHVSDGEVYLSDNRTEFYLEGFKAGYKAGYSDRDKNRNPYIPSYSNPAVVTLNVSEKALRDFKKEIEKNLTQKNEITQKNSIENERE